jgi:gluconate 5-dehydrogenase
MTDSRATFDLSGKTALVTGGSWGLGIQLSETQGDFGARLIISSRKEADRYPLAFYANVL